MMVTVGSCFCLASLRRTNAPLGLPGLTCTFCCLQFEAFARGFMMLCGGPAIHLFSATELERLVCGNPILDFSALQGNARYDGGYHAEHKVNLALLLLLSSQFQRPGEATEALRPGPSDGIWQRSSQIMFI